jgi:DNA (cytosine-5)-methyltransferase 1
MRIGSLFSGYGGLDLAVTEVLGGTVAWHCEFDANPAAILAHHWPDVPNHRDVTAVDWSAVEPVDVLTGGFPCQDLSTAGKRRGLRPGTRSGLWEHMAYAIDQLRPSLVVIENVRGLLNATAHSDVEPCPVCVGDEPDGALRALGAVLGDLASLGYDARWAGVRASDAGAPHGRFRVFIAAEPATRHAGHRTGSAEQGEQPNQPTGRATESGSHAPDARSERHGRGQERGGVGRLDAADAGQTRQRQRSREELGDRSGSVDFGPYAGAVRRWETVLGRPAPAPTEPGKNGPRLSPAFVEWLMGLDPGHVTGTGISRNAQLKALGNGVVPQQAALALRLLLGATT